jgi:hypothetical protein
MSGIFFFRSCALRDESCPLSARSGWAYVSMCASRRGKTWSLTVDIVQKREMLHIPLSIVPGCLDTWCHATNSTVWGKQYMIKSRHYLHNLYDTWMVVGRMQTPSMLQGREALNVETPRCRKLKAQRNWLMKFVWMTQPHICPPCTYTKIKP